MNRINGGHSPKLSSAGTYTLDGNQAVAYSRIRYTAGGDLARAGRQREVLQKIFDKAKKIIVILMEDQPKNGEWFCVTHNINVLLNDGELCEIRIKI